MGIVSEMDEGVVGDQDSVFRGFGTNLLNLCSCTEVVVQEVPGTFREELNLTNNRQGLEGQGFVATQDRSSDGCYCFLSGSLPIWLALSWQAQNLSLSMNLATTVLPAVAFP